MSSSYEPLGRARFAVEASPRGELIRLKPQASLFPKLFLPVWFTGWTFGGIAVISSLFTDFQPFFLIWLCFWAVAWASAAAVLLWMFTGSETIQVIGSDIEIGHHMLGFHRNWRYRGTDIRTYRSPARVGRLSTSNGNSRLFGRCITDR